MDAAYQLRLVCAFVVCRPPKTGFLATRAHIAETEFRRHFPLSGVGEAELHEGMLQERSGGSGTLQRHFLKKGVVEVGLGEEVSPRAELRKWNFAKTYPRAQLWK